jgi:hypothetical protein
MFLAVPSSIRQAILLLLVPALKEMRSCSMSLEEKMAYEAGDLEITQCVHCMRLSANNCCEAFPAGIPAEIISNEFDHTQPYPGDHGLRFKPYKEEEI